MLSTPLSRCTKVNAEFRLLSLVVLLFFIYLKVLSGIFCTVYEDINNHFIVFHL